MGNMPKTVLTYSYLAGTLILFAAPMSAYDFDQGIDHEPALEEARTSADSSESVDGVIFIPDSKPDAWVIMDKSEAAKAREAVGLSVGKVTTNSSGAALFPATKDALPQLSEYMHETYGRCGGFFSYDTKEEALADLNAKAAPVPSLTYTIDQQARAAAMVAKVEQGKLEGTINSLAAFHNRYYSSKYGTQSVSWIASHWRSLADGRDDITVEEYNHTSWAQNSVILTIRGATDPDKVIILGGHADSIAGWWGGAKARAPGADDNASGIAVLTETIRIAVASGYRPAKTVKFMGYAAEEVGLKGSKDIATAYKNNGVNVEGVVQFDMTSFNGSDKKIYFVTDFTNAAQNAFMGKLIDEYVKVPWGTTKCGYACSDHASWTKAGFAASMPFESDKSGMNRNIHTERDTMANAGGNGKHAVHFAKLAVAYMVESAK